MTYRDSYIEGLQLILGAEDSTPDQVFFAIEKLASMEMADADRRRITEHNARLIALLETETNFLNFIAGSLEKLTAQPQEART